MATPLEKLTREIDSCTLERAEEAEKRKRVERELMHIYREHNPGKANEVGPLLDKYAGKEDALLAAVKNKYRSRRWSYVLKNYHDYGGAKETRWEKEQSLRGVQIELDQIAQSVGGEILVKIEKGQHKLVAQRSQSNKGNSTTLYSVCTVEAAVKKMRDIVHKRYRHRAKPSNFTEEHSQRETEKKLDQGRKAVRQRSKRSKPKY
mmetsp:Transcript_7774/g.21648  ORF Transcript_7774/g.21648 Transcript_7774/m.21648 type:complete len:205 (+) Transcript_7774:305-919(+)